MSLLTTNHTRGSRERVRCRGVYSRDKHQISVLEHRNIDLKRVALPVVHGQTFESELSRNDANRGSNEAAPLMEGKRLVSVVDPKLAIIVLFCDTAESWQCITYANHRYLRVQPFTKEVIKEQFKAL